MFSLRSNLGSSSPCEEVAGHTHSYGHGCARYKIGEEENTRAERFRYRRRQQINVQQKQRGEQQRTERPLRRHDGGGQKGL
eukprot:8579725-Heterocapsa_arctica.AAC.1